MLHSASDILEGIQIFFWRPMELKLFFFHFRGSGIFISDHHLVWHPGKPWLFAKGSPPVCPLVLPLLLGAIRELGLALAPSVIIPVSSIFQITGKREAQPVIWRKCTSTGPSHW
jgi:hypothetical protein